jgi:hypothetical protein
MCGNLIPKPIILYNKLGVFFLRIKIADHFENNLAVPQKDEHRVTI